MRRRKISKSEEKKNARDSPLTEKIEISGNYYGCSGGGSGDGVSGDGVSGDGVSGVISCSDSSGGSGSGGWWWHWWW